MENIKNLNTCITKYLIKELKKYLSFRINLIYWNGHDDDMMKYNPYYMDDRDNLIDNLGVISRTFGYDNYSKLTKHHEEKNILEGDFNLSFSDACVMIEVINNYFLQNEDDYLTFNLSNQYWVFNTYCYVYSRILFYKLNCAKYNEICLEDLYLLEVNNLDILLEHNNIVQKIKNVYLFDVNANKPFYKLCNKYINNINKKKTIKKILNNSILNSDIIDKINTY